MCLPGPSQDEEDVSVVGPWEGHGTCGPEAKVLDEGRGITEDTRSEGLS